MISTTLNGFSTAVLLVEIETKDVAVRIEMNPNVFLRLVLGHARATRPGMGACRLQVFDLDIHVLHDDLLARL